MNEMSMETRTVVVEREFPFPAERLWRALTQPHLIAEWLLACDFKPVVGHCFELSFDWSVIGCEVLEVEANRKLSYSWGDHDLQTVVHWTLTPTAEGTHLRMEQSGFRKGQPQYFGGARAGWPRFFDNLERVLAKAG